MLATVKFQQWYNQYHHIFSKALRDNCSLEYDLYLSGNATTRHGIVVDNDACTMVQSCIWDAQNAHIQLDMSAAAVLLGIAPTIISQVGSSLEETSLLFTRQPVLALLVGLVRPAICPTPPFSDASPLNRLYDQVGLACFPVVERRSPQITGRVVEYLLAAAAVANIIWLGYEFSF